MRPVSASISFATWSQRSCFRLLTTTDAPARASPLAMARPMPFVEPVTIATLPVRSNSSVPSVTVVPDQPLTVEKTSDVIVSSTTCSSAMRSRSVSSRTAAGHDPAGNASRRLVHHLRDVDVRRERRLVAALLDDVDVRAVVAQRIRDCCAGAPSASASPCRGPTCRRGRTPPTRRCRCRCGT